MGQNESKLQRNRALTLLQALNDRDQDVIDQCLKHESFAQFINNKVKIKEINNCKISFAACVKNKTCLGYASKCNDVCTVQQLVEAGADVTAIDSRGYTPLHWACESKTEAKEKVEFLLSCDASLIKARDKNNNTPLHRAVRCGNDTVISVLIKRGAEVDERGEFGRTALHYACERGYVACIHELMKHGADVEVEESGRTKATPLRMAAYFNHPDCVKLLIDKYCASINAVDTFGDTALHRAAFKGNLDVIKLLTSYNQCDVHAKNSKGRTAADIARDRYHMEVAHYRRSQSLIPEVTSPITSNQSVDS